jgi:hypothetical protein
MTPQSNDVGFCKTRDDKPLGYTDWVEEVKERVMANCAWDRIGLWLYPTTRNTAWSDVFFHVCEAARNSTEVIYLKGRCVCGESPPDGIKMVALLEKL